MMQVGLPEWLVAMATRDASDHTAAVGALYRRLAEQLAGATSGEATTGERLFFPLNASQRPRNTACAPL